MTTSSSSDLSSNNDDDLEVSTMRSVALGLMDEHALAAQAVAVALTMFEDNNVVAGGNHTVNPLLPKTERLVNLQTGHASMFRSMTGFTLTEWEQFSQQVCPVIERHARHSGRKKLCVGRRSKLTPAERLLLFVLYAKHNTGAQVQAIDWNYSRTSLNKDGVFIADAINVALHDEIQWPSAERRAALGRVLPDFPGCIGHIDGTLCKIKRPRVEHHRQYYNGRKSMYCMNNVIIVDHDGLIIYCEAGAPGKHHDVNCLRACHIHQHWQDYFSREDPDTVGEYLLGDPGYFGAEMYILRRVDGREIADMNPVVRAYNKRHAARRVAVEWGIGGLKNRWRRFLDVCPSRRHHFVPVFEACARMTNFIHKSRMDFSMVDLGVIRPEDVVEDEFVNEWGHED